MGLPAIVTNPDSPRWTFTVTVQGLIPTLRFGHPPIERPMGSPSVSTGCPVTNTKSSGALRSPLPSLCSQRMSASRVTQNHMSGLLQLDAVRLQPQQVTGRLQHEVAGRVHDDPRLGELDA